MARKFVAKSDSLATAVLKLEDEETVARALPFIQAYCLFNDVIQSYFSQVI